MGTPKRGPKLTNRHKRIYTKALNGKRQSVIAKEEGISQQTVSRTIIEAEVILGPDHIQSVRNKLAALSDLAVGGVKRHLEQPLPNPQVLNAHLTGINAYQNKVDVTGNITVEEVKTRREDSLAIGLARFGKVRKSP